MAGMLRTTKIRKNNKDKTLEIGKISHHFQNSITTKALGWKNKSIRKNKYGNTEPKKVFCHFL